MRRFQTGLLALALLVIGCFALTGCNGAVSVNLPGVTPPPNRVPAPPASPPAETAPFGGCHLDANCPEHDAWSMEGRSLVDVRGSDDPDQHGCTGVLLNNAREDGAPLVLVARHCARGREPGETIPHWKFYFGRRSPRCNDDVSPRVPLCTIANKCIGGGTIVAATPGTEFTGSTDFVLMRMSREVPSSFNAYYAGWAIDRWSMQAATILGYPRGLPLAIAYARGPSEVGQACDLNGSMWRIQIDEGQLVVGQSGSPVFDERKYVRGLIRTGAGCSHPSSTCAVDLAYSWADGDPGFRLIDHLAGGDSDLKRLNGRTN